MYMSVSMSLSICGCDEVCVYLFVSVFHGGHGVVCTAFMCVMWGYLYVYSVCGGYAVCVYDVSYMRCVCDDGGGGVCM